MPERLTAAEFRQLMGATPVVGPQIRLPRNREPNKTEAAYGTILRFEFPESLVCYESVTFHLPSGTRYRPDYTVWMGERLLLVVEVKGAHIHNSASIRAFKEARAAWPALRFRFAQKCRDGWRVAH